MAAPAVAIDQHHHSLVRLDLEGMVIEDIARRHRARRMPSITRRYAMANTANARGIPEATELIVACRPTAKMLADTLSHVLLFSKFRGNGCQGCLGAVSGV